MEPQHPVDLNTAHSPAWKDQIDPPPKNFFVGRVRSIRCAVAGLFFMLRRERNTWVHSVATLLVVSLSAYLRLSWPEWCWIIAAIAAVWIAEAFNTAIELLCDVISPTYNELIGRTKDVAATAVLLTAFASVLIGACVFVPHLRTLIP